MKKTSTLTKIYIVIIAIQICVIANFFFNHMFQSAMFESDAAAEVLLAEQIASEGGWVFAEEWFYSTEVEVFHDQLLMVPLFHLTHSYRLTFAISDMIVLAIILAVVYALLSVMNLKLENRLLGICMFLIPYGSYRRYSPFAEFLGMDYYSFFIINSLLFVTLYFYKGKAVKEKIIQLVCLPILCLAMGFCGYRQGMLLFMPLCFYELIFVLIKRLKTCTDMKAYGLELLQYIKEKWKLIIYLVCYFIGFLVYLKVIQEHYRGMDFSGIKIASLQELHDQLLQIVSGIFQYWGFSFDGGQLLSLIGVLMIGLLAFSVYMVILFVKICKKNHGKYAYLDFLCVQVISYLLVLWVISSEDFGAIIRYVWIGIAGLCMVPAFYMEMEEKSLHGKVVLLCACLAVLLANDFCLECSYHRYHPIVQQYDENCLGSYYRNASADQRMGYIDFLEANGYSFGYTTFWNSNTTIALTEGKVRTLNVFNDENIGTMEWLTRKEYANKELYKPQFILWLNSEEKERIDKGWELPGTEVYRDDLFVVYDVR